MEAADAVADELGLPRGWLNESVSVYTSVEGNLDQSEMHWFGDFPTRGGDKALVVRVASKTYLLAMKTASVRAQPADLGDIERLARATGIVTFDAIIENLNRYFPEHQPPEWIVAALRDIIRKLNP